MNLAGVMEEIAQPQSFGTTMFAVSPLMIAAAGIAIMVGLRDLGRRLLLAAVFLVLVGAVSSYWLGGEGPSVSRDWLALWALAVGGSVFILGKPRQGLALLIPAIERLAFLPAVAPVLRETPLELLLMLFSVGLILGFPLLWQAAFGEAADRVTRGR